MAEQTEALICAYQLDGNGGGKALDWEAIRSEPETPGMVWIHLDYTVPSAQQWLKQRSGLDEISIATLLAEEARPRSIPLPDGLLLTLRGVNTNPGADPEDMVAVRVWTDGRRIITTRRRRLLSILDLKEAIEAGKGPCSVSDFIVDLSAGLIARMADVINEIDDAVDGLEDAVLSAESHLLRTEIAQIRREAISLRRYLAPQREAMTRLYNERIEWLDDFSRMQLREIADRTTRYIEDLDSARERASVTQEELMSRLSEQMNNRMYVLSIVAALFLPLGFLTGLLGINVGGIPGEDYEPAFLIFVLMLLVVLALQIWILKNKKWM
jgi:zinc transporter